MLVGLDLPSVGGGREHRKFYTVVYFFQNKTPGSFSDWELEFRDCGAIPVRGLLFTAERWMEGM